MYRVGNARRTLEVFVSRVANKHMSVSEVLQTAMLPAYQLVYELFSMKALETLRRIDVYCASFDYLRSIFFKVVRRSVAKKATSCVGSGFGKKLFGAKNAWIMHRGFAVLRG